MRADRETALVELLLAVALAEFAAHLLGEEAGGESIGREDARIDAERLGLRLFALLARDVAVLDHAVDDPVAPFDRPFAFLERMIIGRRLRQGGEIGGLRDGQLVHGLAVIVQGRGGDAVIAETEIDFVQIKFENLVLRIGALDPEREKRLPDLALERPLVGQEKILGDLLGDGRGALDALAALREHEQGAQDAFGIDAGMGVEILVLGGDEGLLDERRDGGDRQIEAPLARIFGDKRSVARMNTRHHRRLVVLESRIIRQITFEFPNEQSRRARRDDKEYRASGEDKSKETGYVPHATKPFAIWKLLPGEKVMPGEIGKIADPKR